MMKYDSWTARCCDALESASTLDQDHTLVWLVRLQHVIGEIGELNRGYRRRASSGNNYSGRPSEHHQKLIRLGLETQLREWRSAIPERIAAERESSTPLPPFPPLFGPPCSRAL